MVLIPPDPSLSRLRTLNEVRRASAHPPGEALRIVGYIDLSLERGSGHSSDDLSPEPFAGRLDHGGPPGLPPDHFEPLSLGPPHDVDATGKCLQGSVFGGVARQLVENHS